MSLLEINIGLETITHLSQYKNTIYKVVQTLY